MGLGLVAAVAWAAGPVMAGMVVSPLRQEVTARPGETATFAISLANKVEGPVGRPIRVRLELVDFDVTESGAIVFRPAGTEWDSATPWITLAKREVVIAPGTGARVEGRIKVPYTAQGEYYSAVMVTQVNERKAEKVLSLTYRVASGVFVTVPGRLFPRRAEISRCAVEWPPEVAHQAAATGRPDTLTPPAHPQVVAVLRNTGRVRFEGSGDVLVVSDQNRVEFRGRLTSSRPSVHGGDSRRFECALTQPLAPGLYRVKVVMDYQSRWGKEQALLPLQIDAAQAALMSAAAAGSAAGKDHPVAGPRLDVTPARLATEVPRSALRALGVRVKNVGEEPVSCTAGLIQADGSAAPAAWAGTDGAPFALDAGQSRAVQVLIQIPPGVEGTLAATLLVEAVDAGGRRLRREVPLQVAVKPVGGM